MTSAQQRSKWHRRRCTDEISERELGGLVNEDDMSVGDGDDDRNGSVLVTGAQWSSQSGSECLDYIAKKLTLK